MSSRNRLRSWLLALLAAIALATTAAAHDFWLRPTTFTPAVGDDVAIGLLVGDHFAGRPYPRNPRHVRRFVVCGPHTTRVIRGRRGADPAGTFRVAHAGVHVVGYRSTRSRIELEAERFEDYLREEGLDHVVAARAARGESDTPGREVFSRCAKALLRTQDSVAKTGHDRVLGFTAELVPETAPWTLRPGEPLRVRLLVDGHPAAGVQVHAHDRGDEHEAAAGTTDNAGRVELRLPRSGVWMVAAVVMRRAPDGLDAEWESLWASLTFSVPADESGEPRPARRAR